MSWSCSGLIAYSPFAPSEWHQWEFDVMHTCFVSASTVQTFRSTTTHHFLVKTWAAQALASYFMRPLHFQSDSNGSIMWCIPILGPQTICWPFGQQLHIFVLSERKLFMFWLYSTCLSGLSEGQKWTYNVMQTCFRPTKTIQALRVTITRHYLDKTWTAHALVLIRTSLKELPPHTFHLLYCTLDWPY